MTTKVLIVCPPNNHKRVKVEQFYINTDGKEVVQNVQVLEHGAVMEQYVHSTSSLRVTEVD